MDLLNHIALGAQVLFTPANLFFCFIGVLMGTLVGVLPGLGPTAAIALLLPSTFHITPVTAIIMLAGIYYGAMYGGSTTSILVNIPGEAASVITALDGYQMARKGRAGPALGIAAFGSFIAGTISVLGLMLVAPPLAKFALAFGPPRIFRPDAPGHGGPHLPCRRFHVEGPDDGRLRPLDQHDRHGQHFRHPADDLRHPRIQRWRGPDPGNHGALRRGRGHRQSRGGDHTDRGDLQGQGSPAQPSGLEGFHLADPAGVR